jgi:hypothetical protein
MPGSTEDVFIHGGLSVQPKIMGTHAVNNLTIFPDATLELTASADLTINGDFTNQGSLLIDPAATIRFAGSSGSQALQGDFLDGNKLGHVIVNKGSDYVEMNSHLEIAGDLTTANPTSILETNGYNLLLGGNLNNNQGDNTLSGFNWYGGTLEFNGSGAQNFNPGAGWTLSLHNVVIDKSADSLVLAGNMELDNSGVLALVNGKVETGMYRVTLSNPASDAVNAGSASSYIQGNLRRVINATGLYELPVGHASAGYQRAAIEFTSATTIPYLNARFDPYVSVPPALNATECGYTYDHAALNNGYWTINAGANPGSGTYTATLYNDNFSNATTGFWTVMRSNGSWGLVNGSCDLGSTANAVRRTGMNGFSLFGVAQSDVVLSASPLELHGSPELDFNLLQWEDPFQVEEASFVLERGTSPMSLLPIARMEAGLKQTYAFSDKAPERMEGLYRLRWLGPDGEERVSNVIELEMNANPTLQVKVFPNPVVEDLNLEWTNPEAGWYQVEVHDISLQVVKSLRFFRETGDSGLRINLGDLSPGMYILSLQAESLDYEGHFPVWKE